MILFLFLSFYRVVLHLPFYNDSYFLRASEIYTIKLLLWMDFKVIILFICAWQINFNSLISFRCYCWCLSLFLCFWRLNGTRAFQWLDFLHDWAFVRYRSTFILCHQYLLKNLQIVTELFFPGTTTIRIFTEWRWEAWIFC